MNLLSPHKNVFIAACGYDMVELKENEIIVEAQQLIGNFGVIKKITVMTLDYDTSEIARAAFDMFVRASQSGCMTFRFPLRKEVEEMMDFWKKNENVPSLACKPRERSQK